MPVLNFPTTFVSKFLILRRTERGIIKKMYIVLHVKYRTFLPVLIKIQFSRPNFEKYLNTIFHKNSTSWSRAVPCGQSDGQA